VAECNNAPKEKTDTGAVSGGSPNGQSQQAPQNPTQQTPTPEK
jgi:hypothetical protein